jgi:hypothetical protein
MWSTWAYRKVLQAQSVGDGGGDMTAWPEFSEWIVFRFGWFWVLGTLFCGLGIATLFCGLGIGTGFAEGTARVACVVGALVN